MGFVGGGLNNVSLINDDKFDYDDNPETIIHVRLMAWCKRYKQIKTCKKEINKELMLVAWYPLRWWEWCMSKNKKRSRTIFD